MYRRTRQNPTATIKDFTEGPYIPDAIADDLSEREFGLDDDGSGGVIFTSNGVPTGGPSFTLPAAVWSTLAGRPTVLDGTNTDVQVRAAVGAAASSIDVFNVKDYGAVGDNVTDDTVAIQACIDAAEARTFDSTSPNARITIRFPAGRYLVNGGLTVNRNDFHFVGDNLNATRLQRSLVTETPLVTVNGQNFSMRGFTVSFDTGYWGGDSDGNRTLVVKLQNPKSGGKFDNSVDAMFESCLFVGFYAAISIFGQGLEVSNCGFARSVHGVILDFPDQKDLVDKGDEFQSFVDTAFRVFRFEGIRVHHLSAGFIRNKGPNAAKLRSCIITDLTGDLGAEIWNGVMANTIISNWQVELSWAPNPVVFSIDDGSHDSMIINGRILGQRPQVGVNRVISSGFEDTGIARPGTSWAYSTEQAESGTRSVKLTRTGTTNANIYLGSASSTSVVTSAHAVTLNQPVWVVARVRRPASNAQTSGTVELVVRCTDAAGAGTSFVTVYSAPWSSIPADTWVTIRGMMLAPNVRVLPYVNVPNTTPTGDVLYVDTGYVSDDPMIPQQATDKILVANGGVTNLQIRDLNVDAVYGYGFDFTGYVHGLHMSDCHFKDVGYSGPNFRTIILRNNDSQIDLDNITFDADSTTTISPIGGVAGSEATVIVGSNMRQVDGDHAGVSLASPLTTGTLVINGSTSRIPTGETGKRSVPFKQRLFDICKPDWVVVHREWDSGHWMPIYNGPTP